MTTDYSKTIVIIAVIKSIINRATTVIEATITAIIGIEIIDLKVVIANTVAIAVVVMFANQQNLLMFDSLQVNHNKLKEN